MEDLSRWINPKAEISVAGLQMIRSLYFVVEFNDYCEAQILKREREEQEIHNNKKNVEDKKEIYIPEIVFY